MMLSEKKRGATPWRVFTILSLSPPTPMPQVIPGCLHSGAGPPPSSQASP